MTTEAIPTQSRVDNGIEVIGASKQFGDFHALTDVNLSVPDGSMTALLGPSGSGKSTLLRAIAGLEVPSAGKIYISGEDQTGKPVRNRNVGFVFQHYAAFKHMTVFENIAFGPKVRKWPKAKVKSRVNDLIDLVQLTGLGKRYPSSSPVASVSGWPWLAHWPSNRPFCCSTSHSAHSMPKFARTFVPGFGVSTTRSM